MSVTSRPVRESPRILRVLGLSPSQAAVRLLLVVASVALVAVTLLAATDDLLAGAVVLVALSGWAAWRPESPAAGLLVVGLTLGWVGTVPVPDSTRAWVLLLAAAWLLVVVHLCAALAASLPPGASVPSASLRRWARRGVVVMAATVPVWALAYGAGRQVVPGDVSLTYAAIAGAAVLALAVWLLSRDRSP
ncbi:hypothetical protein ABEG17_01310 [Pedococcus sp. KACC 23699]|uniref:DUF3159 domain-containing protein n=1 Tax=Pedococcus sp. KACC 23699 TaxID=3149228 RepID=A0AAU7JU95_9MICO